MLESFSNLHQRIISGVVMAVVALGATLAGGIGFRLLAVAIAAAMFWEWLSMTPGRRSGMALPGGLFLLAILPVLLGVAPLWCLAFAVVLGVVAALAAERNGEGAWTATGFAYAFLTGFCLAQLRGSGSAGLLAILFLFAVVWATDIGAYFIGRTLGGARLAPGISPGKTWSGAIGGAACAGLAGMAMALAAGLSVPVMVTLALLLSVVAQAGDLFESGIKRHAGVKDSSRLIPGHGGVMDRVDGLATAAMALYLFAVLAGRLADPASALF